MTERSLPVSKSPEEYFTELKAAIQKDPKMLGFGDGSRGTPVLADFQETGNTWSEYKTTVFGLLSDVEEVQAIHTLEKGARFVVWILTKTGNEAGSAGVYRTVRNILLHSSSAGVPLIPIIIPIKRFDKERALNALSLSDYNPSDIQEVFSRSDSNPLTTPQG